ncbi:hypothetical protein SAMN05519104_2256 [Rhizobiales bacterium GAS188]|nr:hypothetical protein SAMN05519104_2256 [Rhizobiales bacterium GAS188]
MNEQSAELPQAMPPDLKALIRRAKLDDAERSSVIAELRGAEQARLELLRDALEPVFAQVPPQAELFDHGLVPGEKPRLFVDIVAFIEMARDRRCYRFIQDTRGGTIVLAESEKIEAMTQEVANYLARRLIEREKALSAPLPASTSKALAALAQASSQPAAPSSEGAVPKRRSAAGWQLLCALLLGGVLGAALTHAYHTGQFEHLWPINVHLWPIKW